MDQLQTLLDELMNRGQIHDDALYVALEDRFRGSREEIKTASKIYLPYIETVRDGLVIDLGSGRGEWLELLKDAGIAAHGVEQNRISIEQGRERGFEIVDDDATTCACLTAASPPSRVFTLSNTCRSTRSSLCWMK